MNVQGMPETSPEDRVTRFPTARRPLKTSSSRHRRPRRRLLFWAAFLPLIVLSSILVNWALIIPTAFAVPTASSAAGNLTYQQALQESQQASQGKPQRPVHGAKEPKPLTPSKTSPLLPSFEPATMQDQNYVLDDSFVLHRPQMAAVKRTVAFQVQGGSIPSGTAPFASKGNDGRLEVDLQRGSLDFTHATLAGGQAPVGQLILQIHQIAGHYLEAESILGTYQIQIVDSLGDVVQGVTLTKPLTIVYHYQTQEMVDLGLDPNQITFAWSGQLATAEANNTSTAGLTVPMTNNASAQTLTAQTDVIAGPMTAGGNPEIAAPGTPDLYETSGNSGSYSYGYPLTVVPGPDNFTPQLNLAYSSQATNGRYSRRAPAGPEGEGFSLSLGSITMSTYPSYSINDVDGVSDPLIQVSSTGGVAGYYETEHISHLKIYFNGGSYWQVWGLDGTYYEFGVSSNARQRVSTGTFSWDLDKEQAPFNSSSQVKTLFVTYLQDTPDSGVTIRDAGIEQISYGYATSTTATSLSLTAGTVDFHYHMPTVPSGQGAFATAYGTQSSCNNTTLRCDDPVTYNSVPAPSVMSTMTLDSVTSYVGVDTANIPAYTYTFTYQNTSYTTNYYDPYTYVQATAAGQHLLTQITPVTYVQGSAKTLPGVTFGYANMVRDSYDDPGTPSLRSGYTFSGQTYWSYLTFYENLETGTGARISYATADANMEGTPYTTDGNGNVTDDRFDPLYCANNANNSDPTKRCTGVYNLPDTYSWSEQIVTQVQALGTDSSGNPSVPTTLYWYDLTGTGQSTDPTNCHPITGSGVPSWESSCTGYTWAPSGGSGTLHGTDYADYYRSEFRGFAVVYTLSAAQNLTVDDYFTTEGWGTPESDGGNYNGGQRYQQDIYQGNGENPNAMLQETLTFYTDVGSVPTGTTGTNPYGGINACETGVSSVYTPCVAVPLATQTTNYEGNGNGDGGNAPWTRTTSTYDDLNATSGYVSGGYHNLTQEVVSSSNAPTITKKWTYSPNNGTAGNGIFYYDVNKVTHSEIDDSSGHVWQCQNTTYDEGSPSGVPTPAAGLATTTTSYSTCGNTSTAINAYTGYDQYGNPVATVDGLGATNPSVYSGNGCSLSTAPVNMASAWSSVGRYTSCTTYDTSQTASLPVSQANAWGQTTNLTYDATSALFLTGSTDPNGAPSSYSVSYDGSGNETILASQPGETGAYTTQQSEHSSCTTSSTLPCYEIDSNSLLYSGALSRTFYDSQGRKVETRTPGPTPGDDTVVMTVYNDQNNTVWTSEPFEVTAGAGWINPTGATDINGQTPAGSMTFADALGRTIATQDLHYGSAQEPGQSCSRWLSGTYTSCLNYFYGQASGDTTVYELATSIDPNGHVSESFTDALGNVRATEAFAGVYNPSSTALNLPGTNDDNWDYIQSYSTSVPLNAGSNMLLFSNPSAWAASIDRITLSGNGMSTTSYEAEATGNTLTGAATAQSCSACSGSNSVGNLGMGNTLQFNTLNVPSTGTYTLTIYYIDGDAGRTDMLTVNGNPLTAQVATHYNALNKPTSVTVTDERPQTGQSVTSVTTSATYDDLGRTLTVTDPDQGMFTSTYDANGNVLSVTQTSGASNRTIGYNYDLLNRLGCEQTAAPTINAWGHCSAGSPLVQNTYDTSFLGTQWSTDFPIGHLTKSVATTYFPEGTSASVTQEFQTNARGQTVTEQEQTTVPSGWNVTTALPTFQVALQYNDANQATTTTATAGSASDTFTQVYNTTNGALQGLSSNGTPTANLATLAYNEYAQISGLTYLSGSTSIASEAYSYDANLRPTSLTATWLPGSNNSGQILAQTLSYDNASNITSEASTFASVPGASGSGGSETENFCYNEQNELLWSGNGGTQPGAGNGTCGSGTLGNSLSNAGYTDAYTYTNLGQIWQAPLNGKGTEEQYLYCQSQPHELTGIYPIGTTCANKSGATPVYSASYDAWGNETGRSTGGVTATISYDALNRQVEYNAGSTSQEWYVYDASGNRVLKRSLSGSTTSLTAYAFGLQELSYSGSGTLSSQLDYYSLAGHLIGSTNGTTTSYDLTDAQGSVLATFSASAIQGEQNYGPYGNKRYTEGTIGTDKGYTGQFQDAVSGLDYYNARYYDPVAGVFLSPDVKQGNAQGMDPYAYVGNNPTSRVDPSGQMFTDRPAGGPPTDPVNLTGSAKPNQQIQNLRKFFNGETDSVNPSDLQKLTFEQVRDAVPPWATRRVMGNITYGDGSQSDLRGIVYQWQDADGKIWQVETYYSPQYGPTLHISQLQTDANGDVVMRYKGSMKLPVRTVELDGRTGTWVSSDKADPSLSTSDGATVQAVHLEMDKGQNSVEQIQSELHNAQGDGLWTDNAAAYGIRPAGFAGEAGGEGGDDAGAGE